MKQTLVYAIGSLAVSEIFLDAIFKKLIHFLVICKGPVTERLLQQRAQKPQKKEQTTKVSWSLADIL